MGLFWSGYIRIELRGGGLGQFVNLCKNRGYILYNMRLMGDLCYIDVKYRDFRQITDIAEECGTDYKINGRFGLMMKLFLYKSRKPFFAVILLLCAYYGVNSCFISKIEVEGNEIFSDVQIMQALKENDIYEGRLKFGIDPEIFQNEFIKSFPEISWIWIEIDGTKAKVSIRETVTKPEFFDPSFYCNVVAEKDGVIKNAIASGGTLLVSEGMFVRKGDILISGVYDFTEYAPVRLVSSDGIVNAQTVYTIEDKFSGEYYSYTPRDKTRDRINMNFLKTKLYDDMPKRPLSVILDENNIKFKIFGKNYLPWGFTKTKYCEIIKSKYKLSKSEAEKQAENELMQRLELSLPEDAEIINTKTELSYNSDGSFNMKLTADCMEDIGVKLPIFEE